MTIDRFYSKIDKANFYLGMVSAVYRDSICAQVENLSLFNHREIMMETLIPNTINYFVVVDSTQGLFIGQIYQSKVNRSDSVHDSMNKGYKENVYPEISVDIIGLLGENGFFRLAGFKTVGITDKVYIANQKIIQKYVNSIEINRKSKQAAIENVAKIAGVTGGYLSIKPNTLFDRHLMAIGSTNSGKSTSALSILDKMIRLKKKVLIVDPTGEYEESFRENEIDKLKLGIDTVLPIEKITMQQWSMIFQTNDGTQDTILGKAIKSLRYQKKMLSEGIYLKRGKSIIKVGSDMEELTLKDKAFDLSRLPEQINAESVTFGTKQNEKGIYIEDSFRAGVNIWLSEKVETILENSNFNSFFSNDGKHNLISHIDEFLSSENKSLYINTSEIGTSDSIGTMIIDLISNYIINQEQVHPFVMYIDEVHRYIQNNNNDLKQIGLTSIAREGRKKGIFLFLTTQRPNDVPDVLLGQVGTLIIHRLTHPAELQAIKNQVNPNTLLQIGKLNQGEAILTSINLLQDIQIKFNRSDRVHQNKTPLL